MLANDILTAIHPVVAKTRIRTHQLVALILFFAGSMLVLAQAFIPFDEFIHRGDDAYYYFKVATNYREIGYWSFDQIHPTNGVQPLWAIVLTIASEVMAWFGVRNPGTMARVFVGLAAVLHIASCVVLYLLLARKVSRGTALAAAGAFLFPLGIVWARVWGMENSLYALLLLGTMAYFHLVFLERGGARGAALLGLLLGLTALARLNAGLFAVCLLAFYLIFHRSVRLQARLRSVCVAGAVIAAVTLPYYGANLVATGRLLPISSAVKAVGTEQFLEDRQIESRFSVQYLEAIGRTYRRRVEWFLTSRAADGLWIGGGRLVFIGAVRPAVIMSVLSLLLLGPLALGRPREWLRFLHARFARLIPFSYLLVFGVLDAAISTFLYPRQLSYAMTRWWLVADEIVVTVLVATLLVAFLSYVASRWVPVRRRVPLAVAGLTVLAVLHAGQLTRFYWDGTVVHEDWNLSWNDESYRAARWLSANTPEDARIGSWNAGILGYYAERRVVNLDGLINDFEILPYIKNKAIAEYITSEKLAYVSDIDFEFRDSQLTERLKLTEVYSNYSPFMKQYYRIYRVDE